MRSGRRCQSLSTVTNSSRWAPGGSCARARLPDLLAARRRPCRSPCPSGSRARPGSRRGSRGHSHSVTRVAIEYGSSSWVTASSCSRTSSATHVRPRARRPAMSSRVVAPAPRAGGPRGGRPARRRRRRCGPRPGSRPRPQRGRRAPAAPAPPRARPGRSCSRPRRARAATARPPSGRPGRRAAWRRARGTTTSTPPRASRAVAFRRSPSAVTGLWSAGRVDEHDLGVGPVEDAAHLRARSSGACPRRCSPSGRRWR